MSGYMFHTSKLVRVSNIEKRECLEQEEFPHDEIKLLQHHLELKFLQQE